MKNYGLMQIGLGCENIQEVKNWYAENFAFVLDLIDDQNEATLMSKYTGDKVYSRRAIMSFQASSGAGFEFWQFLSRIPSSTKNPSSLSNLGLISSVFSVENASEKYADLIKNGASEIEEKHPFQEKLLLARDPFGNMVALKNDSGNLSRLNGLVLGVSDLKKWKQVLEIFNYSTKTESDACLVLSLGEQKSPFQLQYGTSEIYLIQNSINSKPTLENRYWGDPGYIHLCFHVDSMDDYKDELGRHGFHFTVDSGGSFQMSKSKGRFAYIEPEKQILIELIEVHKE